MKIVSIKHNGIEFGEMTQSGVKVADCAGAYIADDLSATVTSVQDYDSTIITGNKPVNLNPTFMDTGREITNGYTCPEGVTMTGNDRGSTPGTYIAVYTPQQGYAWSDQTSQSVTVILTIVPFSLCFTANTANSTIAMSITGTPTRGQNFQTSIDGINWNVFTPGSTTITLTNTGDKVYFKGNNTSGLSQSQGMYYQFVMTGSVSAAGDIMSLIDNGACSCLTIPSYYCFYSLFKNCISLTSAPKLSATTLDYYCYAYMFYGCSSLVIPPSISALTLSKCCCEYMFYGCSSLTTAPELPATTMADLCYRSMFNYCTSLITPPALPATTLADSCYSAMFASCTSLTAAPVLSASVLSESCYSYMFEWCTSLIIPPGLPSISLSEHCYNQMFHGCTSLATAPSLPATTIQPSCYNMMFKGCSSLTTPPALLAITIPSWSCYDQMFCDCRSLIVSDTSGSGYDKAWRIPASGTFTTTCEQKGMFANCQPGSGRSSYDMPGVAGQSYTYYTQNTPV